MTDVILTGRLGRDVKTFDNNGDSKTHLLTIMRPRNYKDSDGNYGADAVQVKAFTRTEKAHKFYEENMKKGVLVHMTGDFLSGRYADDNGEIVYTTDIIVDNINPFLERTTSRNQRAEEKISQQQNAPQQQPQNNTPRFDPMTGQPIQPVQPVQQAQQPQEQTVQGVAEQYAQQYAQAGNNNNISDQDLPF